jgi:HB1, ASXL, restriction endonuclease HTH domain
MTYVDAAVTVLKEMRRPLTAREITEAAIKRGLLTSVHRTPEASMSAALYMHVKKGGQRVRCVSEPGQKRALRGSVRWERAA